MIYGQRFGRSTVKVIARILRQIARAPIGACDARTRLPLVRSAILKFRRHSIGISGAKAKAGVDVSMEIRTSSVGADFRARQGGPIE